MALVGDEGKTIRYPATALLTIDSEDRFKTADEKRTLSASTSSPYDFTISPGNGGRSILGGFIRRIGVSEVQFPWVIPNVNNQSNRMIVNWDGPSGTNSATITLINKFYTPSELADAVETAVRALSPDLAAFVIAYAKEPVGLVVNNIPAFFYDCIDPGVTIGFEPLPATTQGYTAQTKQLFDLLGFTSVQSVGAFQPFSNGLFTFCQFTRYIDIECAQLTQFQGLFDGTSQAEYRDSLCRLYLGDNPTMLNIAPSDPDFAPPGCRPFIIYRQFQNMKLINWNARNNIGSFLQFRVFNDCGQPLELNSFRTENPDFAGVVCTNEDWSITLLASEN